MFSHQTLLALLAVTSSLCLAAPAPSDQDSKPWEECKAQHLPRNDSTSPTPFEIKIRYSGAMTDEPSWNLKLQPSTNETYAGSFPVLTKADEHQVFSLVNGVLTTGNRFTPDNDVSKALYGGIAPGDVIPDDAKASPELRFGLGAEASKIRFVSALACNWQGTLYSQLLPDDARIDPHFEGGEDKEGEFIQFFPQYMASNANYGGWWSADLVITPTGPGSP